MSIDFKRQSFAVGWLITNEKELTRHVQNHRSGGGHSESPEDLCGYILKQLGKHCKQSLGMLDHAGHLFFFFLCVGLRIEFRVLYSLFQDIEHVKDISLIPHPF